MSSCPGAEDGGIDPLRLAPPVPVQAGGRAPAAASSVADDGGPDPQRLRRPSGFEPEAAARQLHHPSRMAQDSNLPTAYAVASGFRPGTLPTRSAILPRRAEQSKPTPAGAHSLAARPGPCPVHSPRSVPHPGFEPGPLPSEGSASASWARRALERTTGIEPATSTLATFARYQLRYVRVEPAGGIEPPTFLLPRGCSAD